ncbi:MAG: alpha/beta family hydrolase [Ilumatobacteraceae bacterium]
MTASPTISCADAMLIAPGAGTDRTHASLVALEDALAPLPVERMDFPYRKQGRRAPDRAPKLIAAIEAEAAALAERTGASPERIVLGGRSMGGRMCSMAVADGLPAAALVLVCYPLHPPGKPDNLRVEHLPRISVPCLFVSGTRDSFGTPDELQTWTATIPGPVTHEWIEGKGHDLRGANEDVAARVRAWLEGLA